MRRGRSRPLARLQPWLRPGAAQPASTWLQPLALALALALRFGLSSCGAAYLELALRRQLPVATQDDALRAAALAAGVGCVEAPL